MSAKNTQQSYPEDEFYCDENVSLLFRDTVDFVAESRNNFTIENHDIQDAWYFVKIILREAVKRRDPLTILSGKLNLAFYNSLTGPLQQLLDRDCSVRVYLSKAASPDGGEANRFAGLLKEKIRSVGDSSKYELVCANLTARVNHLIYAGCHGEMYRIETDVEKHTAFGSFGAKESGGAVVNIANRAIQKIKSASSV